MAQIRGVIMSKILTRADILNCNDAIMETVVVKEWGGEVTVRAMSGLERDAFEASLVMTVGKSRIMKLDNIRAKLVSMTVIDPETKESLFTAADIEILGSKSAAALDKIFTVSRKLSGISEDDVEELAKN